jgi:isoleucyl-tRNA synthetase
MLGSELVGTSYVPLFSSASSEFGRWKVIPASHVTAESGTGLVHCAPAHGAEDYHAFRSLGILSSTTDMLCHVDESGRFSSDIADVVGSVATVALVGQEVLGAGSKAILEVLKDLGRLVKVERIKHRYPYDWKTNEPVIVT